MMIRKYIIFFFIMLLGLFAACAQVQEYGNGEDVKIENGEPKNQTEAIIDEPKEWETAVFQHVHGLAYELNVPYDLYLGTHYGVYHIDTDNFWAWLGTDKHRHDVMGFNFINENTMISSGHPNQASNLKDPIGIIFSTDRAQTWEPIALHGEVDFHTFEVNASDSGVLYGIDVYSSEFYRSEDAGYNWEVIQTVGLPDESRDIYSIVSNPSDPMSVLAGTKFGIFQSENGGETWELRTNKETMISAKGAFGRSNAIIAFIQNNEGAGLMKSNDFGETWTSLNLQLEDRNDAVAHIAVHPINEKEYAVGTYKGHLYRTFDGGTSWIMIARDSQSIQQ